MALAVGANFFAAQPSPSVMAGLDPAIHENTGGSVSGRESPTYNEFRELQRRRVDGPHKAGHDG